MCVNLKDTANPLDPDSGDSDVILAACDVEGNFLVVKVRSHGARFHHEVSNAIAMTGVPIHQPALLYATRCVCS